MLFKQHPAAIDKLAEIFYLSEGEKRFLLSCNVGEGLFFAGVNHVAMQVVASPGEHKLITTSPKEVMAMQEKERLNDLTLEKTANAIKEGEISFRQSFPSDEIKPPPTDGSLTLGP